MDDSNEQLDEEMAQLDNSVDFDSRDLPADDNNVPVDDDNDGDDISADDSTLGNIELLTPSLKSSCRSLSLVRLHNCSLKIAYSR